MELEKSEEATEEVVELEKSEEATEEVVEIKRNLRKRQKKVWWNLEKSEEDNRRSCGIRET